MRDFGSARATSLRLQSIGHLNAIQGILGPIDGACAVRKTAEPSCVHLLACARLRMSTLQREGAFGMRRTQTASAIGQSAAGCRAGAISRDVAERESMTKNSTSKAKTKAKPSVTKAAVANAGASRKPAAKAAKSSSATAPRPAMAAKAASVSKRAAAGPAGHRRRVEQVLAHGDGESGNGAPGTA